MTWRRQHVVVAAVLGAAGVLAVVITARDDRPTGAAAARTARPASQTASSGELPVTDLKLELLEGRRRGLPDPERNPFRFQARPAPPPRPAPAPAPVAPAPPPPRAVAPSGPPPIPLRFIGLVDAPTQAGRVAIMSDGRGNVFYGKEGAIIEGRFRVLRVGTESVELSYLDGGGRQMIRLSGQ
jgi:hypothetical protein